MKSIELNWIRNVDKSLVIPEVVFSNVTYYSGAYYPPTYRTIVIDNNEYNNIYGIIEVSNTRPDLFSSILAHEWRHHWQTFNGWDLSNRSPWKEDTTYENYYERIIKYFVDNFHEADALRFEFNHSFIHEEWMELEEIRKLIC